MSKNQDFLIKIAKTVIMQGSYGGTPTGYMDKLESHFDEVKLFDNNKSLQMFFLLNFLDFCNKISKLYTDRKIRIKLKS